MIPDPLQQLVDRFKSIEEFVKEVSETLVSLRMSSAGRDQLLVKLETGQGKLEQGQERIDHLLRGNGKEGLVEKSNRLERIIENIPAMIDHKVAANNMDSTKVARITREQIDLVRKEAEADALIRVKSLIKEEIEAAEKEAMVSPGGWHEFRKTFLLPILSFLIGSILTALAFANLGIK